MVADFRIYFEIRTWALISVCVQKKGCALIGAWVLKGMNTVPRIVLFFMNVLPDHVDPKQTALSLRAAIS